MKIEFEFTSSTDGKLTIDGKALDVSIRPGGVNLKGLSEVERTRTLGGIVAGELFVSLARVMQAWAATNEIDYEAGMWTPLSEAAAFAAANQL